MIRGDQQRRTSPTAANLFDAAEQWAELDPALVVGRGAAAPLSRARSAHERAKRAAAVIGMQIAATGSLDPLTDDGGLRAARPRRAARGTRADEIVEAAINGRLPRPRHLAPIALDSSSAVARDKLAADRPGRRRGDPRPPVRTSQTNRPTTTRRHGVDSGRRPLRRRDRVADVARAAPDRVRRRPERRRVAAVDLELIAGCSGANEAWREPASTSCRITRSSLGIGGLAELVVCAPAGPVIADLLAAARRAGVRCHVVACPVARTPCRAAPRRRSTLGDRARVDDEHAARRRDIAARERQPPGARAAGADRTFRCCCRSRTARSTPRRSSGSPRCAIGTTARRR